MSALGRNFFLLVFWPAYIVLLVVFFYCFYRKIAVFQSFTKTFDLIWLMTNDGRTSTACWSTVLNLLSASTGVRGRSGGAGSGAFFTSWIRTGWNEAGAGSPFITPPPLQLSLSSGLYLLHFYWKESEFRLRLRDRNFFQLTSVWMHAYQHHHQDSRVPLKISKAANTSCFLTLFTALYACLLYTSPSPRD